MPRALACAAGLLLAPLASGWGQGVLDEFSYDQLRFTGIQGEAALVASNRLDATVSGALRVDLGQVAPRLRVLAGVSYLRSAYQADELRRFADALARVVRDPTGDFTIDLGTVHWSDTALDLDFQYLLGRGRVQPFVGLGGSVHVRNGSGRAIDGTFVEDALDTIGAGANFTAGWDVRLGTHLLATLGGRAVLASELRTLSLNVGLGYRVPGSSQ